MLFTFCSFVVGLVIGSFLNVCIYRIPKNKSLLFPRSTCPHCGRFIKWHDNIPLISYLILRGRCRHCKQSISPVYPIVELLTGFLFGTLFYYFITLRHEPYYICLIYAGLGCALIISTFVDLELHIIPNEITYTGLVLAPILSFTFPGLHHFPGRLRYFTITENLRIDALAASFLGIVVAGGLIFLTGVVAKAVLRKEAMGFGDVKLMGMVGGIIGWKLGIVAFFIAPFFGLLMGIPSLILKRGNIIPYAPFLSVASLICIYLQDFFIVTMNSYINLYNQILASLIYKTVT
jgi:leader peptidase (prepilin peptidase)/N-methyltransferase